MEERSDRVIAGEKDAILQDRAWMPHRVRNDAETIELVHLPEEERRNLTFLDHRYVSKSAPRLELPVASITENAPAPNEGTCHYIFHSAFCGSTLLARALDIDGIATVFKEPRAIHDLACILPTSEWPNNQKLALQAVLDLMERPPLPGKRTILKPSNLANPLIERMLEVRPGSNAVLMYAPLEKYLLSIARSRRWTWARRLARLCERHCEVELRWTDDLLMLTDLQIAAYVWLHYQAQFHRLLREFPRGRLASLRSDVFFAQPDEVLAAATELFGLALNGDQIEAITAGPVFHRHSKWQTESFDAATRKREEVLVRLAFGPEIDHAVQWAEAVAKDASIPMELEAPLLDHNDGFETGSKA